MSGPNPPGPDEPAEDKSTTGETEIYSRAYSAPESEQFTSAPYVPPDPALYDYDAYEPPELGDQERPPRWPWVVGVVAIVAAISLVTSVTVLVARTDSETLATPSTSSRDVAPPVQDEITTTTTRPPRSRRRLHRRRRPRSRHLLRLRRSR